MCISKMMWDDVGLENEKLVRTKKGCFHHYECLTGFILWPGPSDDTNEGTQYICSEE